MPNGSGVYRANLRRSRTALRPTRLAKSSSWPFTCVLKDLLKGHAENQGNTKGYLQRRRVFAELDGVHRLACYSDSVGEFLLRHFVALEPEASNLIRNRSRHLRLP